MILLASGMTVAPVDWIIVAAYMVLTILIGLYFSKRASKGVDEFFLSGRNLPWWIAGTSLVAATFSSDTPLLITGFVVTKGLASNWSWWSLAIGGMITVFIYARLWRRSEVMTEFEMLEFRYSGPAASFLRGFRAIYQTGAFMPIAMGGITVAMLRVINELMGPGFFAFGLGGEHAKEISDLVLILTLFGITGLYSAVGGSWGVVVTDFFQFVLAMIGCIVLAFVAVGQLGGLDAMKAKMAANFTDSDQYFRFLPDFSSEKPLYPIGIFFLMIGVQWWASSYSNPASGGNDAQRMASCKNEKHAFFAILWFQIAHYCVRPWPWIIVAFVAMAIIPDIQHMKDPVTGASIDPSTGYPMVIRMMAPAGIKGLMLVTFLSAYMSTISSICNAHASFLVNDVYRRFLRPKAQRKELIWSSRISSAFIVLLSIAATFIMRHVQMRTVFMIIAAIGAGAGTVGMLRWFWWRVNVWSEVTAMIASLVAFLGIQAIIAWGPQGSDLVKFLKVEEYQMVVIAAITIPSWLIVTFLTPPNSTEGLVRFYRKIHPAGPGWGPIARLCPDVVRDRKLGLSILGAFCAAGIIYGTLPGVGYLIFGEYLKAILCLGGAAVAAVLVMLIIKKIGWGTMIGK